MVRFIRKNGRIVPIRDNRTPKEEVKKKAKESYDFAQSEHGKMAIAGGLFGSIRAVHMKHRGLQFRFNLGDRMGIIRKKTMGPRANAATAVTSGAAFGYSLFNSYKHAKKEKSFMSGLGRLTTNWLSFHGGSLAGGIATNRAQKAINLVKGKKTTFSGKTFDAEIVKKSSGTGIKGLPYKG